MMITIRPAKIHDIPEIIKLIRMYAKEKRLLPRSPQELKKIIRSFFVACAVKEENGKKKDSEVVGCVALEVYSRKLAELRSLAVHPLWKGMKIGAALVEACISRAKSRRILEVMAITSSEAFFGKQGFSFALPNEKKALFYHTR